MDVGWNVGRGMGFMVPRHVRKKYFFPKFEFSIFAECTHTFTPLDAPYKSERANKGGGWAWLRFLTVSLSTTDSLSTTLTDALPNASKQATTL